MVELTGLATKKEDGKSSLFPDDDADYESPVLSLLKTELKTSPFGDFFNSKLWWSLQGLNL